MYILKYLDLYGMNINYSSRTGCEWMFFNSYHQLQ